MIFHIPKEIASENKLWKSIYIKDFAIIVIFLVFAWISSTISGIYAPFKIAFFIFMFSIAIILVQKIKEIIQIKDFMKPYIFFLRRIIEHIIR